LAQLKESFFQRTIKLLSRIKENLPLSMYQRDNALIKGLVSSLKLLTKMANELGMLEGSINILILYITIK
jgi:replication initiation and membrane attachment protein DnaB